jgi:hypothetical protein
MEEELRGEGGYISEMRVKKRKRAEGYREKIEL